MNEDPPATRPALRARVQALLEPGPEPGRAASVLAAVITGLILANVLAIVAASAEPPHVPLPRLYVWFEVVSVCVFGLEYALRWWSAPDDPRFAHRALPRLRWALTPMALIDLFAILPFFAELIVHAHGLDLRILRLLRLLRIARVAKLGRYSQGLQALGQAFWSRRAELASSVLVLVLLLLVTSTLVYMTERDAQPEAFGSIPKAMWWGVATLTTVGYGDVVPVTPLGRVLGAGIAVLGIGVFALPAGILSAALHDELGRRRRRARQEQPAAAPPPAPLPISYCPHCGHALHQEVTPPPAARPDSTP
ncbi:MAG: ion transporter [Planctomycetes bacterium]|nr:ion transporter [Planctomycetota bacterium]